MQPDRTDPRQPHMLLLASLPHPAKALVTCMIVMLALGMLGAAGQIVVHDIIPTFFSPMVAVEATSPAGGHHEGMEPAAPAPVSPERGDLFADLVRGETKAPLPYYQGQQFVWTLKWTHIHLFGMSMIFIFMGAVAVGLDAPAALRTWLVVLPFAGIVLDVLAMWLRAFVSPAFFWLHLPGGSIFSIVFAYVALRSLREMWIKPKSANHPRHFR